MRPVCSIAGAALFLACGPTITSVKVTDWRSAVTVGRTLQLTARAYDASGVEVAGAQLQWTSSNPALASVNNSGLVTGVAQGGPVTVRASAQNTYAEVSIQVVPYLLTGIWDVRTFLERCPTLDPAYAQIKADFTLLSDGTPVASTIACTEPYSTQPVAMLTDELIALQTLRTAYYMSQGTTGALPWTPKSFYEWLSTNVDGINFKSQPGQLFCCENIGGKLYFAVSRQDATQRDFKRDWPGISITLDFYAHEIRHADPTGYPHVACPGGGGGCDATYDLNNLGSRGIQYWLQSSWATGHLNIGIGCASTAIAQQYAAWNQQSANLHATSNFAAQAPAQVTLTANTFMCHKP
jgi:hypothetical protein